MSHGTIDELVAHKIPFDDTRLSRQFEPYDYELFDHIIAMDNENVESLREQTHDDPDRKISLLLSFTGEDREIDDPYYTGKYAKAFDEIYRGCEALLEKLLSED
jgi:protein-tyrosine phosphatase